jgi:hypothetical protein
MDKEEFEREALKLFRSSSPEDKEAMIRLLRELEEKNKTDGAAKDAPEGAQ